MSILKNKEVQNISLNNTNKIELKTQVAMPNKISNARIKCEVNKVSLKENSLKSPESNDLRFLLYNFCIFVILLKAIYIC